MLNLFWIDLAGDHADIDRTSEDIGYALASPAGRDIELDTRMLSLEFLTPTHHHRIECPGAGDGQGARQLSFILRCSQTARAENQANCQRQDGKTALNSVSSLFH